MTFFIAVLFISLMIPIMERYLGRKILWLRLMPNSFIFAFIFVDTGCKFLIGIPFENITYFTVLMNGLAGFVIIFMYNIQITIEEDKKRTEEKLKKDKLYR